MNIRTKIAEFFATVFYIGRIKYAPGTFGSLVAFPICYGVMYLTLNKMISSGTEWLLDIERQITDLFIIELLVTLALFLLGTYATSIYISDKEEKDPKEVVIDEVVGQMLVIVLTSCSIIFVLNSKIYDVFNTNLVDFVLLFLLPFSLFRLFDIVKPWPINWVDKNVKGALGVMLDDILAALFAVTAHYVIVFFMLDFYS